MFKLGTIESIFLAKYNPRVKCAADVKNGYVFGVTNNGTNYTEEAAAFADATAAKKGDTYIAYNIIDTPELWKKTDFVISAGSPIRAIRLEDLVGMPVEMASSLIATTYSTLAAGDILVASNATDDSTKPMLWKKPTATTGYTLGIQILEKTTFGTTGIYGKIVKI